MLYIGSRLDYMADLLLGENLRKPELLSGIECMGNNIRRRQNVFEKEATALGSHAALVPTYAMFFFDVVDVGGDVILGELLRIKVIEISKNIAHLGHIVADGHGRIGLSFKERSQLIQIPLGRIIKGYGAQRVFFEFS